MKNTIPDSLTTDTPYLFYDGECSLCNRAVGFIIKHDKHKIFRYYPIGSPFAESITEIKQLAGNIDSVILFYHQRIFIYSDVLIQVAKILGGKLHVLRALWIIPKPIRDYIYKKIALHRYNIFGKKNACIIYDNYNRFDSRLIKTKKIT